MLTTVKRTEKKRRNTFRVGARRETLVISLICIKRCALYHLQSNRASFIRIFSRLINYGCCWGKASERLLQGERRAVKVEDKRLQELKQALELQ